MDKDGLVAILTDAMPHKLAMDLTEEFLSLRQDVATETLGRSSAGKFVETFVQILQYLELGEFDTNPSVDNYLRKLESRNSKVGDDLRVCAARVGRAMYTLRNKRNVAHKGDVDPNKYDLHLLHNASQWILAELVRAVSDASMAASGKIIEQIQAPIGGLIEDFGEHKLVLEDLSTREELLVLLHSYYPDTVSVTQIDHSMSRRSNTTTRKVLRVLWREKVLEGDVKDGYRLTKRGFKEAVTTVQKHT